MRTGRGIQVQEERGPDQAIVRLPAARTAFVGRTLRGPVNQAVVIRSFTDFQQIFGGLWQPSSLSYSVEQYFDNGGAEAVIVRVQNGARPSTLSLPAGGEKLQLRAVRPGTREFLRACVDYDNIPVDDAGNFNLTVQRIRTQGTLRVEDQETFRNLSLSPESNTYICTLLADSEMIEPMDPLPSQRPDLTPDTITGVPTGYVYSNSDGDDGDPLTDYDLIGSSIERTGIFALTDMDDFNFLCIPPITRDRDVGPGTLMIAARFCRERRALLIVDPPEAWATADDALLGLRTWNFASEDALMFFPRILAHDKLRGRFEAFAPCGAVAGMLAKGDESESVWAASDADEPILRPGFRPVCWVADDRRARLAALGVNTLQTVRSPVHSSLRLRTLGAASAAEPGWKYLATRRQALAILNSIERGTRWVAVAGRQPEVASRLEHQVREFFRALHAAGAFGSIGEEDAYFVVADRRYLRDDGDHGRHEFHFLIAFAAERPGQFHCFRISHSLFGSQVRAVTLNQLSDPRPISRHIMAMATRPDLQVPL
ncbi:MAG: hypothetical protein ACHQIL_00615 [Steroidobacterales bacterium]